MRNPFQPLQRITLQLLEEEGQPRYPTMVLDFEEGQQLILGEPQSQGRGILVTPQTPVVVELQLPDGIYRYSTRVQRREVSPPSLVLVWPQEGKRIQRREDVRVPTSIPVELTPEPAIEGVPEPLQGASADLSAGGMRVNLPVLLPAGTTLRVELTLPDHGVVSCQGKVVRSGEVPETRGSDKFWSGLYFSRIEERDRREITKYVFDVQRELLRRGNP